MNKTYQYILFDLDGTLTDSGPGIINCVRYALSSFGIEETDVDKLQRFIGPPLRESFPAFYGFDEEKTMLAIKKYRERYNDTGVFENEVYPGIKGLLEECRECGCKLAIASSKPQYLVEKVLEHFELRQYFNVIVGSLKDGERDTKPEVMEEALRCLFPDGNRRRGQEDLRDMTKEEFDRDKVLMVGDRAFDIEGAKRFGVDSLGVTYGYALEGELEAAGADYVTGSVAGMRRVILGRWQAAEHLKVPSVKKSVEILLPLFFYWLLTQLVVLCAGVALGIWGHNGVRGDWVQAHSNQLAVWINGFAILMTYPFMIRLWKHDESPQMSGIIRKRNDKRIAKFGCVIFLWGAIVALGLNILLNYLSVFKHSKTYEHVSNVQFSVSVWAGILIFGIITPVGEELVFRGVIYNRLKKYFTPALSVLISTFIFGIYHGNLVQFIYAGLMGICMALLYESFERLSAPILFHCGANIFVYIVTKTQVLADLSAGVWIMLPCLLFMAVGIFFLLRKQCLGVRI